MHDQATERVRATALELIDVLGAYEHELSAFPAGSPRVDALKLALSAAVNEASLCVADVAGDERRRAH
jgi:hypothetical protein